MAGVAGGAVLAVAICYGLATIGEWPASPTTDSRLEQFNAGLAETAKTGAATTSALAEINTRLNAIEADYTAKLAAAGAAVEAMKAEIAAVKAPPAADLGPIEAQLKTLSARVDAVAAGASSADAGAIAANLATVQQNLADLAGRLAALDTRAGTTDTAIGNLKSELDGAKATLDQAARAPSPAKIASAMQLPLLISALEADFAAGRPYAADLASLTAAVPEAHVPASVGDAAAAGLPAPDVLARSFSTAMPDMLAARPASADASWQGQMADWVKNLLALRHEGEVAGDSPDAVLSRVEAAIDRHDFAAAAKLLAGLPPPMQQAAGDLGAKVHALADADAFVSGLRTSALAPAAGAQQ
jgi:hypothetical protein